MGEDLRCRACGRAVGVGDRFCAACGAAVRRAPAPDAERKLVSALFVDLVGYTRLSESLDPEDASRLLDPYWSGVRDEIERRGGTVEKFIGDAVVGLFGAPQAHEDDPERAVRAALAVRGASRAGAPRVRVGVATGPALVRVGARPEAGEALVVGDVVTTAARLQQNAPAGAILVDDATYAATRGLVRYRRVQPLAVKGKRLPLAAWRAVGLRADGRRPGRAPRFVGRSRELALLRALGDRLDAEPAPGLVTVVGEPGIGKSRLVHELPPAGLRWEARALPYGESGPFSPLAELVRQAAGIREGDGPADASRRLAAYLETVLPDADERLRAERHVRRLVGLEPVAAAEGAVESFAAWRRVLESAAGRGRLTLLLEDVHWADDALLDFLEYLVEWAAAGPLLVLCTARPELLRRRPRWGGGCPNALTLTLPPLSQADTGRLVADVLGRSPTGDEEETLCARAGGNPLYAEQLARMLRETGALEAAVPGTVHAVIAARLDRLPPGTKQVLSDASVLGQEFDAGGLSALGTRPPGSLEPALHELERLELLERCPGDRWAFRHRLVREVAYGELPRTARAAKHVRVAEWLEAGPRPDELAELVAHHYLRAREEASASGLPAAELSGRARVALVRAAERALGLCALGTAARLYGQALDLWPAGEPGRARQLLRYAYALWNAEVAGEAVALEARDALAAEGDDEGAADAEVLLSEMRWYRGDRAEATARLEHALGLVGAGPPSPARANVVARLARSQMLAARYEEAIARGREALELGERFGLAELQAEALNTIGSARARSGDPAGIADVRRAIALGGASRATVVAYNNLSALLMEAGDGDGSDEAQARGRELAERLGDRLHLEWFEAEAIGRRFGAGEWDEALAAADRWLASPRRPGYATIGVLATRGFVLSARGDPAALDDLFRAESLARAAGDPQTLVPTLAELAFVLVGEGRLDEAAGPVDEALALCERIGEVPPLAAFDLAVAARDTGREERLRRLLAGPAAAGRWLTLAGLYLEGRFEEVLELLPEPSNAWLAAFVRLRAAERGGHGLDEALAYYRSVGAERYVARCEALQAAHAVSR